MKKYKWGEKINEKRWRMRGIIQNAAASARIENIPISDEDLTKWHKEELFEKTPVIRREILFIIKDHPNCTFDFIYRRFLPLSSKTIHYHLAQLQKDEFIYKRGSTRGAVYVAKSDIL